MRHCDLLLLKQPILQHGQEMPTSFLDVQYRQYRYHYCLIMTLPISYASAGGHHRKQVCQFCFGTYSNLARHQEHFKCYEEIPFKIYFKFHYCPTPETYTSDVYPADLTYTSIHNNLEVCGYSLCVVGAHNQLKNQLLYTDSHFGNNAIEFFLKRIFELVEEIRERVLQIKCPIVMTSLQELEHKLSINCPICTVEFSAAFPKVADHDKITGAFRHTLCRNCNSLIRIKPTPIVIGHGIARKELHNILTSLKSEWVSKAKIVMKTEHEILLLELMGVRFLDFQFFLDAPLEQLVTRHLSANPVENWPSRCPLLFEFYKGKEEHLHTLIPSLSYPWAFYTGPESLELELCTGPIFKNPARPEPYWKKPGPPGPTGFFWKKSPARPKPYWKKPSPPGPIGLF
ncbi:hypothetical protein Fcan01_23276 [Folsomia candida]|uniref:C2H2-type domain-containing protein n=1 Tax=Folsomia candida TaxID=158441 RepID=A0A226DBS5_FOLCA|nr:hypothetical protein Fcan01_23276 [Folsomia candida]